MLRDLGTHSSCGPATTDPGGQVALAQVGVDGSDGTSVHFYQAEGAAAGDLTGTLLATSQQDIDPWFHWTTSGYRGIAKNNQGPGVPFAVVETFDRGGKPTAVGKDFGLAAVPDGKGGSALLEATTADHSGRPGPVKLSRMDDHGNYGASTLLDDSSASMLLVNWSTGHVLVLATGSSETRGRWFDERCAPLTGWFSVAGTIQAHDAALRLLVDGTMALSDGTRWVATFRDGEARTQPPPKWLDDRPGTRLATIRGGRGYALLPPQGQGDSFDIVAADGTACGSAPVPKSTPAEGTARQPRRLDVGQDGTLLQMENVTGDRLGFGIHCALRWWPAAMK